MAQWFPEADAAFGGVADAFTGVFSTAGDAAGGLFGGMFGGLGDMLLKMFLIAVAGLVVVKVVA